jgi:D-glycero-alpha-D-manno-heptose-7-phosphate kinase
MLIRVKAPLRISFAGGGTDIPPYTQTEGGCVISATINKCAYGSLRTMENNQINVKSLDFDIFHNYKIDEEIIKNSQCLVSSRIPKSTCSGAKGEGR